MLNRFYCPDTGLATMTQCPAGSYCEEGSQSPTPCPEGTLNSRTMQPSIKSCRPCPPGYYCLNEGNQVVSGTCEEGYFCSRGATVSRPEANPENTFGPCPKGAYCTRVSLDRLATCLQGFSTSINAFYDNIPWGAHEGSTTWSPRIEIQQLQTPVLRMSGRALLGISLPHNSVTISEQCIQDSRLF